MLFECRKNVFDLLKSFLDLSLSAWLLAIETVGFLDFPSVDPGTFRSLRVLSGVFLLLMRTAFLIV
jgi:hypothetical protein